MSSRFRAYRRFILGLPKYLGTPISYEDARATILRRQEQRNQNFLRMVRRCVYGNPASPYLPLLRDAHCEYGDMAALLAQNDLETLLTTLRDAGVRMAFEEFKGRQPIVRGAMSYEVADTDFDNPLLQRGFESGTGGSTGRPSRLLIDLDFLADRAPRRSRHHRRLTTSLVTPADTRQVGGRPSTLQSSRTRADSSASACRPGSRPPSSSPRRLLAPHGASR